MLSNQANITSKHPTLTCQRISPPCPSGRVFTSAAGASRARRCISGYAAQTASRPSVTTACVLATRFTIVLNDASVICRSWSTRLSCMCSYCAWLVLTVVTDYKQSNGSHRIPVSPNGWRRHLPSTAPIAALAGWRCFLVCIGVRCAKYRPQRHPRMAPTSHHLLRRPSHNQPSTS